MFCRVVILTLVACIASGGGQSARADDQVLISEFVASNNSGLTDEDGAFSDWLELYNYGANAVNLDGWYLTDTTNNLTQWRFPAVNLPAGAYLVVFASSKDRAVPGAPLHTNFKLNDGGEYLGLIKPDGSTVASDFAPTYPRQFANVSYGVAQESIVTSFVSNSSPVRLLVATNFVPPTNWMTQGFADSAWQAGTNGVGYDAYVSGFAVKNIRANMVVSSLTAAESVLADASRQSSVFTENRGVINYLNTGGGGRFGGDVSFPGFALGLDENNFVVEATGVITIPASGAYSFGVNSDDGFGLTVGNNSVSFPSPRTPNDTLATFLLPAGEHSVRLVYFDNTSGGEVELFAAAGSFLTFNTNFHLVGDTANGGLAVKSFPVGSIGDSLRPLIATDIQWPMLGRASSAYIRLPFTVANAAAFSSLTLQMKYCDGFVAFLNGEEVARRNVPAVVQWNSTALAARSKSLASVFEYIDLTPWLNRLQNGPNLLAIQGLNNASNSTDFLVLPELAENRTVFLTNHYFATPTPGVLNSTSYFAFVENLRFTPGRGWFERTNFNVTITTATIGASIRYTTNGTAPSPTNGILYTGPIRVSATTVLRAIGYKTGYEPTKVEAHSYIFLDQVQNQRTNPNYPGGSAGLYDMDPLITQNPLYRDAIKDALVSIPSISLTMANEDMFGLTGIYTFPQQEGLAWERPCSIEYMRPDGKKGFQVNCGVRIQGNASRTPGRKHSLRLLFKGIYGPTKLEYDLYPESPVKEFDTVVLHGGHNDTWCQAHAVGQMLRDHWCNDTFLAMGGYGTHGVFVHLYINGLYWGLYNIGERNDHAFGASYLGGDKEQYSYHNTYEVQGDSTNWNQMRSSIYYGVTSDTLYTNLAQSLDIPNFIDFMLLELCANNADWPAHNWHAFRRNVPPGKWIFSPWDSEYTMLLGYGLYNDNTAVSDAEPGYFWYRLRMHPEFRRLVGDRAQRHLFNGGAMTPGPSEERYLKRAAEIERAIICEAARNGCGFTPAHWLTEQNRLRTQWFPNRPDIFVGFLRLRGFYPEINAPAFAPFGGLVAPGYNLAISNTNPSGTIYYTLDGSDPRLWGGGGAPGARAYTGPVVLNSHTALAARIRNGTNWSAIVETTFYLVQNYDPLQITEIMYHPPNFGWTNGDELEFLELKNTGSATLDLSGLQFTDGITFAFTNGTRVGPGQFFVLARNAAAFGGKYPGTTINGLYTGKLENSGEQIRLQHVLGTNVFSVSYGTKPPWAIAPDGFGFSLVRANLSGDADDAPSWRASANAGGSPGYDDPAPTIPAVLINEIISHTLPPETDSIELFNPSGSSADISGWYLSDDRLVPKKFRIPDGTVLAGGGYVVFTELDFNPQPPTAASFALSSLGESLCLFSADAAGNLTGYSHSFEFGAAAQGASFGRYVISTGEEQWPALQATSLGSVNAEPLVGPVVINEIMYHPTAGADEFLELYNLSSSPVALYDPLYPSNCWKVSGLGYTFSNNVTIPAGSYLLLVGIEPGLFRAKHGIASAVEIVGPYPGLLQDSGEKISLERPDARVGTNGQVTTAYIVVDEVRYNDKLPWPVEADGSGSSLQRTRPSAYGNEPASWFASGLTPGATNRATHGLTCRLFSPNYGASFDAPADILLSAVAINTDGPVLGVEFYDGMVKLGEATNAPYSFIWSNAPVGVHTLLAKAQDGVHVAESEPVVITVTSLPNTAPWLGPLVDQTVDEGMTVSFTATADDEDIPVQVLTFSLGPGAPAGASINPTTGFFSWTPAEWQAPGTHVITVRVTDSGGDPLSDSTNVTIVVNEVNAAPALAAIPDKTAYVGHTLNFSVSASDPDQPALGLTYSLGSGAPAGATIDPSTGVFSWTPLQMATNSVTIQVVDNGSPVLSDEKTFTIRVLAAPVGTNITLVSTGAVWKYRDTGENLGTDWVLREYDDSAWQSGRAQLGYGDGDEATIVNYGPSSVARYITTYFRTYFVLADPGLLRSVDMRLLRDDGAVIYINGQEVYRANMPSGAITYTTRAAVSVGGYDEFRYFASPALGPELLVAGTNVVAVEVHQSSPDSSDLSFDMDLVGNLETAQVIPPVITMQPQSQTVSTGATVTFTVTASGSAPLRYGWRLNGAFLANATNTSLLLTAVQAAQAGGYTVVITNAVGAVTSAVATLTIQSTAATNTAPVLAAIANRTVAVGSLIMFTAAATDADLPAQALTYSLGTGAPAGASINPSSGVFSWTPTTPSTNSLTIRVTDNGTPSLSDAKSFSISVTSAPVTPTTTITLIATGSVWRYRDTGENLGTNWVLAGYDDSTWRSGRAQLGYGDGDEATIVSYGPSSVARYITTYFRTYFVLADPALLRSVDMRLLRDDGAVIYVNGQEVFRANMPAGTITYTTRASVAVGGLDEFRYFACPALSPDLLVAGTNVVAVELHQASPDSSDLSFDMDLVGSIGSAQPSAPVINTQPQSQTVSAGGSATFTVTASGTAPLWYGWRLNGAFLPNATNASLVLTAVQAGQAGGYSVVITNAVGAVTSAVATLTIQTTTVTNTAPVLAAIANRTVAVGSLVTFTATATDADLPGQSLSYSLGSGAPAGASITPSTGVFSWTPTTPSTNSLTIRVTDNGTPPLSDAKSFSISVTSAPVTSTTTITLIATGSVWRYRDTGENLGTNWSLPGYDDSGWRSGRAQLGYGDGDEATIVNYGPSAIARYITTYFRNYFVLDDPAQLQSLTMRLLRDDGAVIYVNGQEVFRANMPAGTITYTTRASVAVGGLDEFRYFVCPAPNPGLLVAGTNVVAVEVHQSSPDSSDLSFDMDLVASIGGTAQPSPPVITMQPQSQTVSTGANVTLTVTASGTAPLWYGWRLNGAFLANATNTSLLLTAVQAAQAGGYTVVITNAVGAVTSAVATLTVQTTSVTNAPPVLAAIANRTVAVGSLVAFTATATDADLPGQSLSYSLESGAPAGASITPSTGVFSWTPTTPSTNSLTIRVTDNGTPPLSDAKSFSISVTSAPVTPTTTITLIATGSVWRYRDTGENLGTNWSLPGYDDSGWRSGRAQLGYGDGDEATIVSYGPNAQAKYITTYFRRAFLLSDPYPLTALNMRLLRDDGAVVYLNGREVFRTNMPAGTITYATRATVNVATLDEVKFFPTPPISPALLVPGTNVVAVEIHQISVDSSDISFNLELTAAVNTAPAPAPIPPVASSQPNLRIMLENGNITLWWPATPRRTYRVQYATDLSAPEWTDLGEDFLASDETAGITDTADSGQQRFYRVLLLE